MVLWGCRQRAGGALLTPFPVGNSRQLLSGPFLLFLSPSSLFSGAGPRLSSWAKGVDTGTPSPKLRPRPWAETDTPPSSSMALPGGLLWVYGQGASSGCPGWGLRAWKHMERGQTAQGRGRGQVSGSPRSPSPGEPLLVSLAGGSRQVHSSGCAPTGLCPHRCAPARGPQQV